MFHFGVDYYPEHWPEDRWPHDVKLMQEAGFNTVRLGEFAWSRLEPQPDCFDCAWLEKAVDLLAAHGMQIVLGTPTASAPPWVMELHPDAYRVLSSGLRVAYGNRRFYCPSHPGYRARGRAITEAMAARFGRHPAVIGWQIDNEFGDRCYCDHCRTAFQQWLAAKYGSLDALNEAWGTVFWSHEYRAWSQIPVPLATAAPFGDGSHNPGLALDYARFMSATYADFQREQLAILRAASPERFMTHNLMGIAYDQLDYFELAAELDLVSWDNYRRMQWTFEPEVRPSDAALAHATMRGLKQRNFWVMEQQAGAGGWQIVSVAPRPGELQLWAYQAIAHGADGIIFFRWRTARHGTEQYWHGLLEHDGRPGRRYREIKQMGAAVARGGPAIDGSMVRAEVAIVLDYTSRFAFQIQANSPTFSYVHHLHDTYQAFHRRNVAVDIVSIDQPLAAYKLVVLPAQHVLTAAAAAALEQFVAQGGTLVVTPRSGVKDEHNAVVDMPLPGQLATLCGIVVEEYDSLPEGVGQPLEFLEEALQVDPPPYAWTWCDVVTVTTAQEIARFSADFYAGRPAITLNRYGDGCAVYLATFGAADLHDHLAGWLLQLAALPPGTPTPAGVELCTRWQGDRALRFVLNHTGELQTVRLAEPAVDLLTDARFDGGDVQLQPYQVLVLVAPAAVAELLPTPGPAAT